MHSIKWRSLNKSLKDRFAKYVWQVEVRESMLVNNKAATGGGDTGKLQMEILN